MKIYKIISLSIIILLCVAGILVGLYAMTYYNYSYLDYKVYNGTAYTDIQNAIVTVDSGIRWGIADIVNISGWVLFIAFFIKLMNTIGKLIEAIKDCKEYYAQKKKKEMERQASMYGMYQGMPGNMYPNYAPQQQNAFNNSYTDMPSQQNNTDMK